jgi:Uma2 family endonuclease
MALATKEVAMRPALLPETLDEAVCIPPTANTLSGFRRWMRSRTFPDFGRISFLGGEIVVDMSAEDIINHNDPKRAITVGLSILVDAEDLGRVLADGSLLINRRANVSNEPDVMFCSWDTLGANRVKLRTVSMKHRKYTEVIGQPDLVVEVVSDSSVRKDCLLLARKYFQAGIPEYWLIDCRSDDAIDFQMLTRGRGGYRPIPPDDEGFRASKVLLERFRLVRTRDRIGLWKHRLEYRPAGKS